MAVRGSSGTAWVVGGRSRTIDQTLGSHDGLPHALEDITESLAGCSREPAFRTLNRALQLIARVRHATWRKVPGRHREMPPHIMREWRMPRHVVTQAGGNRDHPRRRAETQSQSAMRSPQATEREALTRSTGQ